MKKYACYEPGFEGDYSEEEMVQIYNDVVDKKEYKTYDDWLYDMLKSGVYVEVKK